MHETILPRIGWRSRVSFLGCNARNATLSRASVKLVGRTPNKERLSQLIVREKKKERRKEKKGKLRRHVKMQISLARVPCSSRFVAWDGETTFFVGYRRWKERKPQRRRRTIETMSDRSDRRMINKRNGENQSGDKLNKKKPKKKWNKKTTITKKLVGALCRVLDRLVDDLRPVRRSQGVLDSC